MGLFSTDHSLIIQIIGVLSYGAFCLIGSFIVFSLIKSLIGLRVSEDEEIIGLDIGEHEMESYAGFEIFTVE